MIRESIVHSTNDATEELLTTSNIFGFRSLRYYKASPVLTVSSFLAFILPTVSKKLPVDLREPPFMIKVPPTELSTPFFVSPLNGVNALKTDNGGYFIWATQVLGNNRPSHVTLVYISKNFQDAIIISSGIEYPSSSFQFVHGVLSQSPFFYSHLKAADTREDYLGSLTISTTSDLVFVPATLTSHFGHYIQQKLAHLSRLERLGLLSYFSKIYLSNDDDYLPDVPSYCFNLGTRDRIAMHDMNREEIIRKCLDNSFAVISTKDSTMDSSLWRSIKSHAELHLATSKVYSIVVGVRGGTRQAKNLPKVLPSLVSAIHEQTNQNVHIVIDGMAKSINNSSSTHADLSLGKEQEIASQIKLSLSTMSYASCMCVVGLDMYSQLKEIMCCRFALGHAGSSTFKYMTLAGIPVILHGIKRPWNDYSTFFRDETWAPRCLSFNDVEPDKALNGLHTNYLIREQEFAEFVQSLDYNSFVDLSISETYLSTETGLTQDFTAALA